MWSIWLEPTGALNAQLHQIIKRLATSHGGPEFVPHVTLVGGIPCTKEVARERAQKVAARLQPYYITFSNPDQYDRFTKCVFLRCKEAPQTMQAERLARAEFDDLCGEGGDYEPHLSLLYATPQLEDRPSGFVAFQKQQLQLTP